MAGLSSQAELTAGGATGPRRAKSGPALPPVTISPAAKKCPISSPTDNFSSENDLCNE